MNKGRIEHSFSSKVGVPRIFQLIEGKASYRELLAETSKCVVSGDREGTVIGVVGILSMTNDPTQTMLVLARLSSEEWYLTGITEIIKNQLAGKTLNLLDVEMAFGVQRFPYLCDTSKPDRMEIVHNYARSRHYIDERTTLDELDEMIRIDMKSIANDGRVRHLDGTIEGELIAQSLTFGVQEPGYLEILGRERILRLREMEKPRMLLLGSLGKYSGVEFSNFARRINPDSSSLCIDIEKENLPHYDPEFQDQDIKLTLGDACRMPFRAGTMDHVFTNSILHDLRGRIQEGVNLRIVKLVGEIARVLKPGGSVILGESFYLFSGGDKKVEKVMVFNIARLAESFGLKVGRLSLDGPAFVFRGDVGKVRITPNGFCYYDGLVIKGQSGSFMEFLKE
jgi:SAM-dependent methyltransferase